MTADDYVRVLVGCGADKRDEACAAKNLYTSDYFTKKRDFAELYGDDWYITSAKHHILHPDEEIEPYDKSLTNMSAAERRAWGSDASDQLRELDWEHVDIVVLLMGQLYIEPIEPTLETFPVTIGYPFEHTEGNGEQISWLKKRITEAKHTAPGEEVTLSLGPIEEASHDQTSLAQFEA